MACPTLLRHCTPAFQAERTGKTARQVALGAGVLVDAMGSFSPIARQARRGAKPDSVVLMVGSCATGLPAPHGADLLYSFTHLDRHAIP